MADPFGFLLTMAARLMRDRFEAALRAGDLEMTPSEARTLTIADRLCGPRQTELAKALGVEPMSLVNQLDRLERRDLIVRNPDPRDRRVRLVHLTEKAKPEIKRIRLIFDQCREEAMQSFSAEECVTLTSLLLKLCNELTGANNRIEAE